jgi:hypothetical protein
MLYFASQGRSNMLWPFIASGLRFTITVGGAAWLARTGAPFALIVAPAAAGSVLFGIVNIVGFSRSAARLAALQPIYDGHDATGGSRPSGT